MSDSEELSFTQGSFSWLLGRSFSAVGFPLWIKEVRLPARMLRRKRAVLFHFYTPEERNMLRGMCSILLLLISTVASAPLSPVITTFQTVYKSGGYVGFIFPWQNKDNQARDCQIRKFRVVIWQTTSKKCTKKRAVHAAQLFFLIEPIKLLICDLTVVFAVPFFVSLTSIVRVVQRQRALQPFAHAANLKDSQRHIVFLSKHR